MYPFYFPVCWCDDWFGQREPAPTSAPTWMDGTLKGLSFLSLCHPRMTFLVCPFSALISVFFCNFILSPPASQFFLFWKLYFVPAPHPVFFFFFAFETFPTHPPTTPHGPPSTYSPINLKCVTLIPTHLPTTIYFSTYQHFRLVPTKPHLHGYTYQLGWHFNGQKWWRKNRIKVLQN